MATSNDYYQDLATTTAIIDESRRKMAKALASRGYPTDENTSLPEIAACVERSATEQLGSFAANVIVTLNAGEGAFVPDAETEAALLQGAVLEVTIGLRRETAPIATLADNTVLTKSVLCERPTLGAVKLRLNAEASHGMGLAPAEVYTTLVPGDNAIAIDLKVGASQMAGKVFGIREYLDLSFPEVEDIIETIAEDGTVTAEDTGYLDSETGAYVSTSPIERAIPQFDLTTGRITKWNNYREHARNDLFGIAAESEVKPDGIFPFNAIRRRLYSATAPDSTIVKHRLVEIGVREGEASGWFVSIVATTHALKVRNADGSFTTSLQNVREFRFSQTQRDASYTFCSVPLIGEYHVSRRTYTEDGGSKSIEYTDASGNSPDIGTTRASHLANITRANGLPSATLDGIAIEQKPAQVSMFAYQDNSKLLPLIIAACGTRNTQAYIQGHTSPFTDAGQDNTRQIGVTKPIADAGYFIGTFRAPSLCGSFVLFGIENLWGSIGTMVVDMNNVSGRFWHCADRTKWTGDYTPKTSTEGVTLSAEALQEALGYRLTSVVPVGGYIRAMRADDADPLLLIPAQPTANFTASSSTAYGDNVWLSSGTGTTYIIALGNNRSGGLGLGAASVVAGHVWSYAYGDNWSARATLQLL